MFEKALTVYAHNLEQEFAFTLNWKGVEINIEVSTHGRITIDNITALTQSDQAMFRDAIRLASHLQAPSANRQALIQNLRAQLSKDQQQRAIAKFPLITSRGTDPFDYYYVSLPSRLPKIFGDAVPAINIFVLFIASMFLIPEIANTSRGVFTAIALSTLALMIQLLSKPLEKKIGVAQNRYIQDIVSATILSISSFSAISMLVTIFANRALILANKNQNTKADFTAGVLVTTLAAAGMIGTWFLPSVAVMGPRVQATAVKIERSFLKEEKDNFEKRKKLIRNYKHNEGRSLAQRFVPCLRKEKIATDVRYDERAINPPSMLAIGKRLGGAFVLSAQLSQALGINPRLFETLLIPIAALSLLHPFVSRKFEITARNNAAITIIPALSDKTPYLAKSLKWLSEIAGVSYNSLINPAVTLFFVCEKILHLYNIGNNEQGSIGPINGSVLTATFLLNTPSLILDLASRGLGIDRFEGWSPSRLSYILDEAENLRIRKNLEQYLHLIIEGAQQGITFSGLPAPPSPAEQVFYSYGNASRQHLALEMEAPNMHMDQ